jgi:hypothetical protein
MRVDDVAGNVCLSVTRERAGGVRHRGGRRRQGMAVQAVPIKPTLKAPGPKPLKLKCEERLSTYAFKFKLCRYTKESFAAWESLPRSARLEAGAHTRPPVSST